MNRTLKVVFKRTHVLDDSDDLSDGEGGFTYCVDAGECGYAEQILRVPAFGNTANIKHENRELVIPKWNDGPVTIAVQGIDDDALGKYLQGGCELSEPKSDGTADQNIARFTIDTAAEPSLRGTRGVAVFEDQESLPGGALMFSITGTIEILRPTGEGG
ncbi:MAG: hypothetical protein ACRETT_01825 [Steroidobacteraceae bacterium]